MLTDAGFLCVGAVDCLWGAPFWKQETRWSRARYLAFNFFSEKIWGVVSFTLYIIILICFYIFYLVFTRCGAYEEALSSFQKSGNWRQVFCMASLLRHTDEQVISLARSVAGMNSFCVSFHENAKPVICLMITVRCIENQSICETLSTLEKNVLSKSTFLRSLFVQKRKWLYWASLYGYLRTLFSSRFFPSNRRLFNEIFLYQKLFCFLTPVGSSSYHDHVDGNEKIIGSLRNGDSDSDGNANARISKTTTLHVNHAFCTFLYRHCTTTTWKCSRVLTDFSVRQSCS